ncbi:unnamed protein product [Allacma fusca]|uniref:LIM zinc-binding domain-containing protein n=1 Tax=Allacma fusca TaxID=39272 RepID=A0A8J2KMW4_9HEXA|nr:unnamed protein product [Allacma fusca]
MELIKTEDKVQFSRFLSSNQIQQHWLCLLALLRTESEDLYEHVSKCTIPKSRPRTSPGVSPSGSVDFNGSSCAGCGKRIVDRFLLKALDMFWHEDCLKCGCCDCRLGEVGSTLYTKANLILCKRDYLRLFGNTGYCAACSKVIPAFEMVMRARANVYHLECFACQQCNHRFCVGDRFYLCENKILCEYDYEERMVFANMAYSPGNLALLRSQDSKTNNNVSTIMNSNSNSLSPKLQSLSPSSMGHHQQPVAQRTAT